MEAVLFIGIQASGKSTFFIERFYRTHVRINLDMLKTRHREELLVKACLEMKQPFVVDNTNPTAADRARYIVPAKAAGFRVVGYFFRTELKDAIQRNLSRDGKARIPDQGIHATHARLEVPALAEEFDRLCCVTIASDGAFMVEDWRDGG